MERFRGATESTLADHERRMAAYQQDVKELQISVDMVALNLAKLGVKVALATAVSALLASGIVSVIVLWLGHKF